MALELMASAAVSAGGDGRPLSTASVRVNFVRQFRGRPESLYVGTALRVGRSSGIADARAVGDDGAVAILARVTAYR
jgi:acyl-coenzyme A thioesterase PaaI-like protein